MARPILVTSDLHVADKEILGRPRLPVCMGMMAQISSLANTRQVEAVVLIGDLIDMKHIGATPDKGLKVLLSLADFFQSLPPNCSWYWIRGNHETPYEGDPTQTVMRLFRGMGPLKTVIEPEQVYFMKSSVGYACLHMLPWYPAEEFRRRLGLIVKSINPRNRNILLTHVGLRGGLQGVHELKGEIKLEDLHPEAFSQVILGDYHMPQQMADSVWYCGSPIPKDFSEQGDRGVWLFDTETLQKTMIPLIAPRFDQWEVETNGPIEGFDPENYNKIRAPEHLHAELRLRYPGSQLLGPRNGDPKIVPEMSRLSVIESGNTITREMMARYGDLKGWPPELVDFWWSLYDKFVKETGRS